MKTFRRAAVPAVLIGIGIMGVVADSWLVRAATGGNGASSDPDYYDRALAWDDHMEATATAVRLGVRIDAEISPAGSSDALLCVTVRDSAGASVETRSVTAAASANLCPRARFVGTLERSGERYCTAIRDACAGIWIADVRAEVADQVVAGTGRTELRVPQ